MTNNKTHNGGANPVANGAAAPAGSGATTPRPASTPAAAPADLNSMETLTEDEREHLTDCPNTVSCKALRIIDQQNEALVAYLGKTLGLEAEVERLRARLDSEFRHDQLLLEVSSYRSGMMAVEARLAAANALLGSVPHPESDAFPAWADRVDAHLAGQPAVAQTRTPEIRPGCTRSDYYEPTRTEHKRGCICVRCEAEQAVLDAMSKVSKPELEWINKGEWGAVTRAELARRSLKP